MSFFKVPVTSDKKFINNKLISELWYLYDKLYINNFSH